MMAWLRIPSISTIASHKGDVAQVDALDTVVVLMGFGLPDDNLHAPNEKMHLPNFYKGIRCSIAFMEEFAQIGRE